MRIVHVTTNDIAGGAARATYRLHNGLRQLGYDSFVYVARQDSSDPAVKVFKPPEGLPARLRRRVRLEWINRSFGQCQASRPNGYEHFHGDRTALGAAPVAQLPRGDVINLHWVAGFVDYRPFFSQVPPRTPVVWTLHDMNPFTGGCHYDHGCGRYTDKCGACPQLGSTKAIDLSRWVWQRKRRVYGQIKPGHLHIVAPCCWMAAEIKRSSLLRNFPLTIIPNSLDTDIFSPRDRRVAREALDIPQEARVILFVAASVSVRRKGFAMLTQTLSSLSDVPDLFLVSLGSGEPTIEVRIPHIHLGLVQNERWLSLVYSAADLFLIPSLQDNLPNTILESLACGTPVVGFDVGGIPDAVRPGVTGLLAPAEDIVVLSNTIRQLLEDEAARLQMAANCRRIATEEYALNVQALRYLELYERILPRNR
jgi:glycosyltransferase involved in cell wall biosynthesis